jgi:hypothetical protein
MNSVRRRDLIICKPPAVGRTVFARQKFCGFPPLRQKSAAADRKDGAELL